MKEKNKPLACLILNVVFLFTTFSAPVSAEPSIENNLRIVNYNDISVETSTTYNFDTDGFKGLDHRINPLSSKVFENRKLELQNGAKLFCRSQEEDFVSFNIVEGNYEKEEVYSIFQITDVRKPFKKSVKRIVVTEYHQAKISNFKESMLIQNVTCINR